MHVGVVSKVLGFEEIFGVRKLKTQLRLDRKVSEFMTAVISFLGKNCGLI